jgi:hypothetical protein
MQSVPQYIAPGVDGRESTGRRSTFHWLESEQGFEKEF